jgi:aldose 1-epimerase
MRDPAGTTLALVAGDYRAEVVTLGAGLRSLTRDGQDLVAGYPAGTICPDYRGWVLMPWPNRIDGGRYEFAGNPHQLPINEVENRNALHGLVGWSTWIVVEHADDRVLLRFELPPQPGYPFALDVEADYRLSAAGLEVTLRATNAGGSPAPYGVGIHPYLTVGRRLDECVLKLPASERCPTTERGLPGPPEPVAGTPYDFREARTIGTTVFDDPFSGIAFTSGRAEVRLLDPATGRGVVLGFDDAWPWLQVFSGDSHGDLARTSLAVEPMSCPPDAFRTGTDLVVLEPGETHRATYTIAAS